ncbi:MAG: DUF4494 family protein [Clostridia bacterium]|nr:DUF4494 family protein [Clostridia bacterium]
MGPKDKYWLVNLQIVEEDEKGKIKKNKEVHLVDAFDVVGVEKKVKEMMEGETREWTIQSITRSPIIEVY